MDNVKEITRILELLLVGGYIEIKRDITETQLLAYCNNSLENAVKDILKLLK
jgi:hypothetical protein